MMFISSMDQFGWPKREKNSKSARLLFFSVRACLKKTIRHASSCMRSKPRRCMVVVVMVVVGDGYAYRKKRA